MRRFLRLLTLWLVALALPTQGAAASATVAQASAPTHPTMTMPDGTTMDAAAMPCHRRHPLDKSARGACCGPIAAQQLQLAVAATATPRTPLVRSVANAAAPLFLTGGTERPPRAFLA